MIESGVMGGFYGDCGFGGRIGLGIRWEGMGVARVQGMCQEGSGGWEEVGWLPKATKTLLNY